VTWSVGGWVCGCGDYTLFFLSRILFDRTGKWPARGKWIRQRYWFKDYRCCRGREINASRKKGFPGRNLSLREALLRASKLVEARNRRGGVRKFFKRLAM